MSYRVEMTRAAHWLYKKFDAALQEQVKKEAQLIAADPMAFKKLKPPFKDVWSYRFSFQGVPYRIAYAVDTERQVLTIVLVHARKSFYRLLRRALGY